MNVRRPPCSYALSELDRSRKFTRCDHPPKSGMGERKDFGKELSLAQVLAFGARKGLTGIIHTCPHSFSMRQAYCHDFRRETSQNAMRLSDMQIFRVISPRIEDGCSATRP